MHLNKRVDILIFRTVMVVAIHIMYTDIYPPHICVSEPLFYVSILGEIKKIRSISVMAYDCVSNNAQPKIIYIYYDVLGDFGILLQRIHMKILLSEDVCYTRLLWVRYDMLIAGTHQGRQSIVKFCHMYNFL